MPEKIHIHTEPIPPRVRPVGKLGIIDWREDYLNRFTNVTTIAADNEPLPFDENDENADLRVRQDETTESIVAFYGRARAAAVRSRGARGRPAPARPRR